MITLRQLQRLWDAKEYRRIMARLLELRPEGSPAAIAQLTEGVAAAAMIVIRLDELNQPYTALCRNLIREILSAQQSDGGWIDAMSSALCLRALVCGHGQGPAIDRGLAYLANLQRPEGLWPKEPLRRMPGDPLVTVFVLYELFEDQRFAQMARIDLATRWFDLHRRELDTDTARLWKCVSMRPRAMAGAWS